MFNRIAPTYDRLNHTLSLGIDRRWRRKAIDSLKPFAPQVILDVATGTGDFAILAAKRLDPGAMVASSSEILTIVATDPLRALFDVPTTSLPLLRPGEAKVRVTVDAYPDDPVDLVVDEAYPTADAGTRTVTVRASLPNPDGRFRPGMFATGAFALDERADVLVVPFEAVLRIRDRRCVYKVQDGKAVLADVEAGLRHDDVVEIVSGLAEGDEIVVDGLHRLADGAAVRVVD
jgi:membrane fusion protein (multidrug efflux system)